MAKNQQLTPARLPFPLRALWPLLSVAVLICMHGSDAER